MYFLSVRIAIVVLLVANLTGCITSHLAIDRAKGYETFPPRDPQNHREPQSHPKPNAAYYGLLAVTVPIDIVTFPIQVPVMVALLGQRP